MWRTVLLALLSALFLCSGCGGGSDSGPSAAAFSTLTNRDGGSSFDIDPPKRPPPKHLLTRDIEVGSGPVAHRGDDVYVYYVGDQYSNGKPSVRTWPPDNPLQLQLGFTGWGDAWEEGIEGMRAGGLRELVIPEAFQAGGPAIDYVVRLVKVAPPT